MNNFKQFVHFIIGILTLAEYVQSQEPVKCDPDAGFVDDNICYTVVTLPRSWDAAKQYCEKHHGKLASVTNVNIQTQIANKVQLSFNNLIMSSLWIGAREYLDTFEAKIWQWLDGTHAGAQGCFIEADGTAAGRDMEAYQTSPAFSRPLDCINTCRSKSYTYAGVQNGGNCGCGNDTFGTKGFGMLCDKPCTEPNNMTMWCGSANENHIYDTRGTYTEWAHQQPNNAGNYQLCAGIDQADSNFKFEDMACWVQNYYICTVHNMQTCDGGDNLGNYYLASASRNCYYISKKKENWFKAKENCQSLGHNLVKIDGTLGFKSQVHEELRMILNTTGNSAWRSTIPTNTFYGVKLWIGLSRAGWMWETGETFHYTNWYGRQPDSYNSSCAIMIAANGWNWSDESCTRLSYFVCQGGDLPKITTTSSTTSVTTPIASVTTQKENGGNAETTAGSGSGSGASTAAPVAAGSTGIGSLTNVEIVLIVLMLVLAIIALLVLILLCVYCCKKKETKVDNSSRENFYAGIVHPSTLSTRSAHSARSARSDHTTRSSVVTDYSKFIDINDETDFFSGSGYQFRY